ncbi:hypothetical protein CONPUDRAFT_169260 [Coniophora puteana RWD-64-598 SS2]|uniref:PalH-domain-containing protein n=1 Tax=Coniophora puteana (strain RWD-64-598) TaxID=741705 RepID=A0A5M3M9V7_CONPW|nr:uncharacterized protein CONPUDRAFT_169260 [Coniophora puteana RWD-64-598 SS2]EIW76072.1 hypothetical protein CONPUDRAFT_169260 [Coniophora puteana RWD-64-598 SS2]
MLQPNGIPLDTAAIVSTVLEGILYGFSVFMFIGTIWSLTTGRKSSEFNSRMITVACLLLIISTTHMVIDIIRTQEGLVKYRDTFYSGPDGPNGPLGFFSDVAEWSFVAKNLIYTLQTLVGDGVVIYRCYVVWQSRLVVIVPLLLWCSVAVTGAGCVYSETQATTDKENIFASGTGPWITAFLVSTLVANLISTTLLAYRIWNVSRRVGHIQVQKSTLWPFLRIILDSGILYSITLLAALLCFVAKNRGHYVLLDMIMPIISITFYLVIIRVTLKKSSSQDHHARPTPPIFHGFTASEIPFYNDTPSSAYPLKRLEVHMTHMTETHEDEPADSPNNKKDRLSTNEDIESVQEIVEDKFDV